MNVVINFELCKFWFIYTNLKTNWNLNVQYYIGSSNIDWNTSAGLTKTQKAKQRCEKCWNNIETEKYEITCNYLNDLYFYLCIRTVFLGNMTNIEPYPTKPAFLLYMIICDRVWDVICE